MLSSRCSILISHTFAHILCVCVCVYISNSNLNNNLSKLLAWHLVFLNINLFANVKQRAGGGEAAAPAAPATSAFASSNKHLCAYFLLFILQMFYRFSLLCSLSLQATVLNIYKCWAKSIRELKEEKEKVCDNFESIHHGSDQPRAVSSSPHKHCARVCMCAYRKLRKILVLIMKHFVAHIVPLVWQQI